MNDSLEHDGVLRGEMVTFLRENLLFPVLLIFFDRQMSPNLASAPKCHLYLEYRVLYYVFYLKISFRGDELKYGVQGIHYPVYFLVQRNSERNR